METDTRCILDILSSHFYSKIGHWQKNNELCMQLILVCICVCALRGKGKEKPFLILVLLLPLLAHHFSPQLVTVAHPLLSLIVCRESWKPGQCLPQVTPIWVLGCPGR